MKEYAQRYQIALAKAREVEKMNMPESKKEETYRKLAEWIDTDKDIDELPFPFGTKPHKI